VFFLKPALRTLFLPYLLSCISFVLTCESTQHQSLFRQSHWNVSLASSIDTTVACYWHTLELSEIVSGLTECLIQFSSVCCDLPRFPVSIDSS